jgi:hypothetical protein
VREQVVGLEDDADVPAHLVRVDPRVGDVPAVQLDDAVVHLLQQVRAAQQRRLARAARADQRGRRAVGQLEVDALQHPGAAEDLADLAHPQDRRHQTALRGPRRCDAR